MKKRIDSKRWGTGTLMILGLLGPLSYNDLLRTSAMLWTGKKYDKLKEIPSKINMGLSRSLKNLRNSGLVEKYKGNYRLTIRAIENFPFNILFRTIFNEEVHPISLKGFLLGRNYIIAKGMDWLVFPKLFPHVLFSDICPSIVCNFFVYRINGIKIKRRPLLNAIKRFLLDEETAVSDEVFKKIYDVDYVLDYVIKEYEYRYILLSSMDYSTKHAYNEVLKKLKGHITEIKKEIHNEEELVIFSYIIEHLHVGLDEESVYRYIDYGKRSPLLDYVVTNFIIGEFKVPIQLYRYEIPFLSYILGTHPELLPEDKDFFIETLNIRVDEMGKSRDALKKLIEKLEKNT